MCESPDNLIFFFKERKEQCLALSIGIYVFMNDFHIRRQVFSSYLILFTIFSLKLSIFPNKQNPKRVKSALGEKTLRKTQPLRKLLFSKIYAIVIVKSWTVYLYFKFFLSLIYSHRFKEIIRKQENLSIYKFHILLQIKIKM